MNRTHVIICMAFSRVGSTFLRRLLTDHPDAYITNETRLYLARPWTSYFHAAMVAADKYPLPKDEVMAALEDAYWSVEEQPQFANVTRRHRSAEASATCLQAVEDALLPNYRIVGDKGYTPGALKNKLFGEMAKLMDLRVIFLYRDPRDTFASIGRHRTDYPYNVMWAEDPRRHSIEWIGNMRSWKQVKREAAFPILEVKYEELMATPRPVLRSIARFLGLRSAGPMVGSFKKRVAKRDHIGYWKRLYPGMEDELHPDIWPIMEEYGYLFRGVCGGGA